MKIYTALHHRLKSQHFAVEEIVANISVHRMLARPVAATWNIHDNIAHLAKYQITFINRAHKILKEDLPYFERYNAEDDAEFALFRKQSDADLLQCIHDQRILLTDLVVSLTEKDLQRIGIHKKYGHLNIVQWLEFFLLHEAHHIFTLFQLANDTEMPIKTLP